ncbi:hypothetical protein LguiA_018752 [Lonicera macranthoides]
MAPGAAAAPAGDGCIPGHDTGIRQRPYHRNCSCALHKQQGDHCHHRLSPKNRVIYPMRRAWSESFLSLMGSGSGHCSPSSPAAGATGAPAKASLFDINEDD